MKKMHFGSVLIVLVVAFLAASGWAQDVTRTESPAETTPVTEDNAGTTGFNNTTTVAPAPPTEQETELATILASNPPVSELGLSEAPTAAVQVSTDVPEAVASVNNNSTVAISTIQQETNGTTTTLTPSTSTQTSPTIIDSTTTTTTTTTTSTTLAASTHGVTEGVVQDRSTTAETIRETTTTAIPSTTLAQSTSSSTSLPTTTDHGTTTTIPSTTMAQSTSSSTSIPTTTDQGTTTQSGSSTTFAQTSTTTRRRSTTTTPHQCTTSMTCDDPNSACVNQFGYNTCQCHAGYIRLSPKGKCLLNVPSTTIPPTSIENTSETGSSSETHASPESSTPMPTNAKRNAVRQASDLNKYEIRDVVSISLQPVTSVVEWILEQDLTFRRAVAEILASTNLTMNEESEAKYAKVSAEHVLYVAPSPQITEQGLLVSFLVLDKEGVSPRLHSPHGIIARHRRDVTIDEAISTGYLSSDWIVEALRNSQSRLEEALNQTVASFSSGGIPQQLYSLAQFSRPTLFEQRLEIFIPVILVAAVCVVGLAVSLVCIRTKTKSMARWDPPAGVVFGKTSIKKENREDPLGCIGKPDPVGHHLATDEQCRDGEEQLMKHSARINSDDDGWVVPYEEGPSCGPSIELKAQYEDTKL